MEAWPWSAVMASLVRWMEAMVIKNLRDFDLAPRFDGGTQGNHLPPLFWLVYPQSIQALSCHGIRIAT